MISLCIVFSYLNKLLWAFLHELVFFEVCHWVEKEGEHDVKSFVSEVVQILFSFQGVIKDVNAFDEDSLHFEIIDNAFRLIEEGEENDLEQLLWAFGVLVGNNDNVHDDPFDFVDGLILLADNRIVVMEK